MKPTLMTHLVLILCAWGSMLGVTAGAAEFADDFADGTATDWTIVRGRWGVINGEFVETSDAGGHNIAINGPVLVSFQLTARLRSTDDDDIGLVFRFRDSKNFWLAVFNAQNARIELRSNVNGRLRTLARVSTTPYPRGTPFEVTVRAEQEHIQVFLDDQAVIDVSAAPVTSGRIGLYSRYNRYAAFDDIRAVALEEGQDPGGNVIYVDARNDGGTEDGLNEATAWGTINEALQDPRFQDSAGNTVIIKAGVYREQVDVFERMSGLPGAFNTIRAADGAEVVVDGEKDTPRARVEGVLIHTGVSHVRLEGLVIRNAQHRCILVFASGPAEVVGNRIHGCGDAGIEFWYGAHDYEVANNVIYGNEGEGIVLSQGSGDPSRFAANQRIVIRNNLIFENGPDSGDGILVRGDRPHTFSIYNNTIVNNLGNGIFLNKGVGGGDVRNNIVADNRRIGLKNFSGPATSTDFNNLFSNGALGDKNFDGGATGAGPGPHTISADPRFVNPATGDFRLRAGSPSIDSGDPHPRFTDADGTRNDMGAYGGPADW